MEVTEEQIKEMQRYWYLQGVADKEKGNPMQFVPEKDERVYNPVALEGQVIDHIIQENYKNGREDMLEELKKTAIHCKVFWYDGPKLDYTQEQQDDALERIGAGIDDKILLVILKDDTNEIPTSNS